MASAWRVGIGAAAAAMLVACAAAAAGPQELSQLSHDHAIARGERVRDVAYRLEIELGLARRSITGRVEIAFELDDPAPGLVLDYTGGHVQSLRANGSLVEGSVYDGSVVRLPAAALRAGANRILLDFVSPYSRSGVGIHRFDDPEDGSTYVYTNFQPYNANRVFPCFDQPDLKARFQLEVVGPRLWTVVSAGRELSRTDEPAGRARWVFETTPPISTYVFFLGAGPFESWEDPGGGTPLRLFARKSAARFVPVEEWFALTRAGLHYFEDYFDRPYPFAKYDQLVVPEFAYGAMENVAAVTFSERFLRYGPVGEEARLEWATTVLHEQAHMWFGNLVTPRWWDDLWLNESFATFMSFQAASRIDQLPDPWLSYFAGVKQWAYWEDRLVTTHPIASRVPSTREVFANFDGITYGKGAAAIQQLKAYLGEADFRDGIRRFLAAFEFGSASLDDLLSSLSGSENRDLERWRTEWLDTAGLNTVEAKWECASGSISRFELVQSSPPDLPTLRVHRTSIGTYLAVGERGLRADQVARVLYRGRTSAVSELVGAACPILVLPNVEDSDYANVRLDARSLESAADRLSGLEPPLARMMVWRALWEMVRDGEIGSASYLDTAMRNLAAERNPQVVAMVARTLPSAVHYLPATRSSDRQRRDERLARLERFLWERVAAAPPGGDLQRRWFEATAGSTRTGEGLARLHRSLAPETAPSGLELDQPTRWRVIRLLSSFGVETSEALIEAELGRDHTGMGPRFARSARVARPDPAAKQKWFRMLSSEPDALSFDEARSVAESLYPPHQEALREQIAEGFFASLAELSGQRNDAFLQVYTASLAPLRCEPASRRRVEGFLAGAGAGRLATAVVDTLRVAVQEDARCERARLNAWQAADTRRGHTQEQTSRRGP